MRQVTVSGIMGAAATAGQTAVSGTVGATAAGQTAVSGTVGAAAAGQTAVSGTVGAAATAGQTALFGTMENNFSAGSEKNTVPNRERDALRQPKKH